MVQSKRPRTSSHEITVKEEKSDFFDGLPDDLVVSILCKLSSSASCPSDFINILLACKRLNRLGLHHTVLSKAAPDAFAVQPKNWSDAAHRFIKKCVNAGNTEACYTLGMIRFYCLEDRGSGASLMARAAKTHAQALYSLAVIQFNGSGGSKRDKDLRAGVSLCARAAYLGHIDALRELGHCLQDGYGVRQNVTEGRRLLVEANARELASYIRPLLMKKTRPPRSHQHHHGCVKGSGCPLLSDFGCDLPARKVHQTNRFLKEWFESGRGVLGQGLRLCSYGGCGRPETRAHEYRRCSVCGTVNYCSRGCQALDWRIKHKVECVPNEEWNGEEVGNGVGGMVEMEDAEPVIME
ncbi:F-box protein [Tripterygium wilfordii]|uniref:F-box protein n=1 Tax=Tripterygium wilfordii TaxID=458696 RepID=A0A7J7CEB5_TRIWF|nr:F-box protein At1g67340-like [Tripterygium wilfordii]KAF5732217.1 F-box protein [Tripterygium wilfordii]